MSISINSPTTTSQNAVSEVLDAKLSSNLQELEGEMVLQLIQSANPEAVSSPVGNIGTQVNIKV